VCFEDGRFEIDNGRVERQIREAGGRPVKNYYFSGSPEAAQKVGGAPIRWFCSCKNAGIPTRDYLVDVMTQLRSRFSPCGGINELRPRHLGS